MESLTNQTQIPDAASVTAQQATPTQFILSKSIGTIDVLTVLILIFGFILTFIQLQVILRHHKRNHDWNRRKASEEVCISFSENTDFKSCLEKHLDWRNLTTPLSMASLRKAILKADGKEIDDQVDYEQCDVVCGTEGSKLVHSIHRLLNYYESFSRGIEEKVYDERVIKRAFHGQMRHSLRVLRPYIVNRRNAGSDQKRVWIDFEQLVEKWDNENNYHDRDKTG